jgi:Phytanoyl-CoA dioxygenase (PhyH)
MDHLATNEDRRARWYYSKPGVWPHYLPLRSPSRWQDLLWVPPPKIAQVELEDNDCVFDFVYSLPIDWLRRSCCFEETAGDRRISWPAKVATFEGESGFSDDSSDDAPSSADQSSMILDNDHVPRDLLRRILDVHGFAVISGVLSTQESHEALELAWDWMEAASRAEASVQQHQPQDGNDTNASHRKLVNRQDPSSHSAKDGLSYFPRSLEGSIMPFYGAGHSAFAWRIRSHPNVKQIFAQLYNINNPDLLLSSLDGVILWTEPSTDCGWFHIDQNPVHKPQESSVQGLVHLTDVTPATGGNVLVLQSHLDFDGGHFLGNSDTPSGRTTNRNTVNSFYRDRLAEIGDDDWLEIDPNDGVLLDPRRIVTLLLNAGDVLLWDSRVAHCSYPPIASSSVASQQTTNHGFLRAATLVTMVPCNVVSEQVKRERRNAVDNNRTLSHWVDKAAPLGEERTEHVALEKACVEFIRDGQLCNDRKTKVLLGWDDLSDDQKSLVVGR